jgi:hypothetical protein
MLGKLRPRSVYDVCAALALFVALGGTAYAVNTVGSSDIIDGEVKSIDIGQGEVGSADVKDNSLNTFDVHSFLGVDVVDGTLTGADIANESIGAADIGSQQVGPDEVINDSLLQSDIRAGAVTSDEVLDFSLGNGDFLTGSVDSRVATDNSLTGTDINEATLNLPQTLTTATFAGAPALSLPFPRAYAKVSSKNVPAGSYAVMATINAHNGINAGDHIVELICELRNGNDFIGGATDRQPVPDGHKVQMSLSMNGGAQVPAGGGELSVWCISDFRHGIDYGQLMAIRLDGFF